MKDIDLDNESVIAEIDSSNMLTFLEEFPIQCEQAIEIGRLSSSHLIADHNRIKNIVILGMGGSGISGDIAKAVFDSHIKVPILVNKSYELPAFVDGYTLVLAVSYSGNTEEVLAMTEEASSRGSQIVAVSSGGKLLEFAEAKDLPYIHLPGGLQPRLAVGYLTLPILIYLSSLGLVYSIEKDLEELAEIMGEKAGQWGMDVPLKKNQAKSLALKLRDKIPLIYGDSGISGLAALRWKCQFNENSKIPAFYNKLPELNHNEIVGWEELVNVSREFYLISLRDCREDSRISRRFEVTKELIFDRFAGETEIISEGKSRLARLFSLIYLGDFTSVYAAFLNDVDPTPVNRIELLKNRLSGK